MAAVPADRRSDTFGDKGLGYLTRPFLFEALLHLPLRLHVLRIFGRAARV